ncbi:MAG: hypothetical protein IT327_07230 [Anaerolineae bacterium]|nr:hypothetical protein [Anaerolineae bacterium]
MELAESFSATVQLVSRTRALRAPCGGEVWVFSLLGVILTPKSEKTLDLWPRQARSAEVGPRLYRELNGYGFSK